MIDNIFGLSIRYEPWDKKSILPLYIVSNYQFCYEMTIVKWKYHISLIIVFSSFFCVILIKDTGQETSIQIYRRLATLLYVDWLPQVNGFAASFFVYSRESNLWNKKCLHR